MNNCIEILLDFSAFFHVTRSFLYQSDCRTFQTSILKKQAILNLDIIQRLNILGASELIKYFCLVMVRHTQFFLDQPDSKILETPITQKKFQLRSYFFAYGYMSIEVTYQCSYLSSLCQGMPKVNALMLKCFKIML